MGLLAQLILGDGRGPLPPRIGGHPAPGPSPSASHQQRQPQGLLMCATGATPTWSSTSATPSYSQQPNRHIPVATLPTKPQTGSSSTTSGRMSGATPAAATSAPPPSATVTSAEASMMQPLNLSKRIESKNSNATSSGAAGTAASMASSAPNNAEKQTAASNGHDIPTEA